MTRFVFIYIGVVLAAFSSCNDKKMASQLDAISKITDTNPDSALVVLSALEQNKEDWAKNDKMYYELVKMKAENKADVQFTSDSIIKDVVKYYKGRDSNDLMLAYYLLGRAYSDMGEAPEALQAYYDAIESAETTREDFDYNTLIAVYGQMSQIFHKQNLPEDEIWALRYYVDYIRRTDTAKEYIIARQQMMRPYYLLNEKDSILKIINETYLSLKQLGEDKEAADALVASIYLYIERDELEKAQHAMEIFEQESGLFDQDGNIAKGREAYYNTKAYYELAINNTASAEKYFRKAIEYGHLNDAYKGMLSIYREKGNIDSVMHYSILYENSIDSLHKKCKLMQFTKCQHFIIIAVARKKQRLKRRKPEMRVCGLSVYSYLWLWVGYCFSMFTETTRGSSSRK